MDNRVLNVSQAATYLGLAPQSLHNMRFRGVGPAYHKLGSRVVYRISDLELYLMERRIIPQDRREGAGAHGAA